MKSSLRDKVRDTIRSYNLYVNNQTLKCIRKG